MDLRNVQVHGLIALMTSGVLDKPRVPALDLNTAAGRRLNMLYILTTLADNLGTQVESRNGFKIDGNALIWPFAL